jgi:hypothetical protein
VACASDREDTDGTGMSSVQVYLEVPNRACVVFQCSPDTGETASPQLENLGTCDSSLRCWRAFVAFYRRLVAVQSHAVRHFLARSAHSVNLGNY